jgi:hypothetical protein
MKIVVRPDLTVGRTSSELAVGGHFVGRCFPFGPVASITLRLLYLGERIEDWFPDALDPASRALSRVQDATLPCRGKIKVGYAAFADECCILQRIMRASETAKRLALTMGRRCMGW